MSANKPSTSRCRSRPCRRYCGSMPAAVHLHSGAFIGPCHKAPTRHGVRDGCSSCFKSARQALGLQRTGTRAMLADASLSKRRSALLQLGHKPAVCEAAPECVRDGAQVSPRPGGQRGAARGGRHHQPGARERGHQMPRAQRGRRATPGGSPRVLRRQGGRPACCRLFRSSLVRSQRLIAGILRGSRLFGLMSGGRTCCGRT